MKKFISAALALCFVLSLSITAFADDEERDTIITTSIQPTYTVTVPSNTTVKFNDTETAFGEIKVDAAQIEPDKYITVALTTDGALNNEADTTKELPYTITDASGTVFTSAKYNEKNQSTALTINITQADWAAAYAGDYSDTVTFTISYGE